MTSATYRRPGAPDTDYAGPVLYRRLCRYLRSASACRVLSELTGAFLSVSKAEIRRFVRAECPRGYRRTLAVRWYARLRLLVIA